MIVTNVYDIINNTYNTIMYIYIYIYIHMYSTVE